MASRNKSIYKTNIQKFYHLSVSVLKNKNFASSYSSRFLENEKLILEQIFFYFDLEEKEKKILSLVKKEASSSAKALP
ncbi:hypothetical protein BpHYR1_007086 [Brachionus plicatilis]|uniref:Uncharacterized protein n=1 Tax=Brachionus plicatilis TaxID=10195 RepID=A0A3M7P471_BRAPC|nr:hypothetical protein BpHYR1_007086 [Brachionus plicatilis]